MGGFSKVGWAIEKLAINGWDVLRRDGCAGGG